MLEFVSGGRSFGETVEQSSITTFDNMSHRPIDGKYVTYASDSGCGRTCVIVFVLACVLCERKCVHVCDRMRACVHACI